MKKLLLFQIIVLVVLWFRASAPAYGATSNFYVDPDFIGPTRDGSPSRPWQSLSDAGALTPPWTAVNNSLSVGPVTVYFSARNASSDTDQTSSLGIALLRSDRSANRLTLDGMAQYNTNDALPVWVAYSGAAKFSITSNYPVNSENSSTPYPERNYITIRGFKLAATDGQIAELAGMSYLIFENNECRHSGSPTTGPGVLIGRPQAFNGTWPSHVSISNNFIYRTFGEGIYVGGSTSDPPGAGSVVTGNDILISGNTIIDAGWFGGQGDGIDVKDGNVGVRIIGNTVLHNSGWVPREISINGIVVESADLIEKNFVNGFAKTGITTSGAWNNTFGRDRLVIRNNILVDNPLAGIRLYGGRAGYAWSNTQLNNNTIYRSEDGIVIPNDGNIHDHVSIINNIAFGISAFALEVPDGAVTTSDYNDFYSSPGSDVIRIGVSSYSADTLSTVEPHSISVDPMVTSLATPYVVDNFTLQSNSPVVSKALRLTTFNDDYFSRIRGDVWDLGAAAAAGLRAPTNLRIVQVP